MSTTTNNTAPPSQAASARSVPALITFWLLGLWSAIIVAKFLLIYLAVLPPNGGRAFVIDATVQTFLSNAESTTQNLLIMAVSFWVGSTVGAKALGDTLAESNKAGATALATIAGAAPHAVVQDQPQPVVVTNEPGQPVPVTDDKNFMERPVP